MRILLVDDEPSVTSILATWLAEAGHRVTAATDFKSAAHEMKSAELDAVIVDVRLGEFNGLQLAIMARGHNPGVRIVVISGYDDPVLKQQAETCGATYLQKPFTATELVTVLNETKPGPIDASSISTTTATS
jgi:DNA-binding response OmpR family regulator